MLEKGNIFTKKPRFSKAIRGITFYHLITVGMCIPQWPLKKTSHNFAVTLHCCLTMMSPISTLKHPFSVCGDSHSFASIGGLISLLQNFHFLTHLMKCGLYSIIYTNPVLNSQLPAFFYIYK